VNGSSTDRVLSVVFRLGSETYVLPAADVIKIIETKRINRLPRLPEPILGITQHRGRVVTVVDLHAVLFGPSASGGVDRPVPKHVLLLDRGQRNAGIIADVIEEIAPVRLGGSRPGPVEALKIVQHRGRAVSAIVTDALLHAIEALGGAQPEPL
jgi:chemotaxis signal transduction protein